MDRKNTRRLRRLALVLTALFSSTVAAGAAAQANTWKPTKPVEFVVPALAGGSLDRPIRLVQKIWQDEKLLNVPVVIVNRGGGGQAVGYTYVHQHAADPHRLLVVSGPLISNHISGRSKLNYTDFTLIGQLYNEYNVLAVRADGPFKTANDLIAKLKGAPDSLSVAIGTTLGNNSHIAVALPFKRAGIDIKRLRTVVFPSAGESISNLLGGHLDYSSGGLSVASAHWKAGKVRLLAITAPKRLSGEYASIPTWKEQGVDITVSNSRFILAPPGLTPAQVAYWDGLFRRTVASPEWKKVVLQEQWVDEYIGSGELRKYMEREYAETREILADLGMAK